MVEGGHAQRISMTSAFTLSIASCHVCTVRACVRACVCVCVCVCVRVCVRVYGVFTVASTSADITIVAGKLRRYQSQTPTTWWTCLRSATTPSPPFGFQRSQQRKRLLLLLLLVFNANRSAESRDVCLCVCALYYLLRAAAFGMYVCDVSADTRTRTRTHTHMSTLERVTCPHLSPAWPGK